MVRLLLLIRPCLRISSCSNDDEIVVPATWHVSRDIIPSNDVVSLYVVASPDGQLFLVSSKGCIIPYTPKPTIEAPR